MRILITILLFILSNSQINNFNYLLYGNELSQANKYFQLTSLFNETSYFDDSDDCYFHKIDVPVFKCLKYVNLIYRSKSHVWTRNNHVHVPINMTMENVEDVSNEDKLSHLLANHILLIPDCEHTFASEYGSFRSIAFDFIELTINLVQSNCRNQIDVIGGSFYEVFTYTDDVLTSCPVIDNNDNTYSINCRIPNSRSNSWNRIFNKKTSESTDSKICTRMTIYLMYEHFDAYSEVIHFMHPPVHWIIANEKVVCFQLDRSTDIKSVDNTINSNDSIDKHLKQIDIRNNPDIFFFTGFWKNSTDRLKRPISLHALVDTLYFNNDFYETEWKHRQEDDKKNSAMFPEAFRQEQLRRPHIGITNISTYSPEIFGDKYIFHSLVLQSVDRAIYIQSNQSSDLTSYIATLPVDPSTNPISYLTTYLSRESTDYLTSEVSLLGPITTYPNYRDITQSIDISNYVSNYLTDQNKITSNTYLYKYLSGYISTYRSIHKSNDLPPDLKVNLSNYLPTYHFIGSSHMRYWFDATVGYTKGQDILANASRKHTDFNVNNLLFHSKLWAYDQSNFLRKLCRSFTGYEEFERDDGTNENKTDITKRDINPKVFIIQTGAWDLYTSSLRRLLKAKEGSRKLIEVLSDIIRGNIDCPGLDHIVWMTSVPFQVCNIIGNRGCNSHRQFRSNAAISAEIQVYLSALVQAMNSKDATNIMRLSIIDDFSIIRPRLLLNEKNEVTCQSHFLCRLDSDDGPPVFVATPGGNAVMQSLFAALSLSLDRVTEVY